MSSPEPPDDDAADGTHAAPRRTKPACARCQGHKKSCVWTDGHAVCGRCSRLNVSCEPADTSMSRRARERLKKAEKARQRRARPARPPPPPGLRELAVSHQPALPPLVPPHLSQFLPSPIGAAGFGSPAAAVPIPAAPPDRPKSTSPKPVSPGSLMRLSPTPHPGTAPPNADVAMLEGVAAFWAYFHATTPVVHRPSFEAAFDPANAGRGSPVYGIHPPLPLLYAVAANGIRFAALPGWSHAERAAMSRFFCARARDTFLAAYVGVGMPDLEALQVLYLVYNFIICEQTAPASFVLQERCVEVLRRLCDALSGNPRPGEPDTSPLGLRPPVDAHEWLHTDTVLRLQTAIALWDVAFAYLHDRPLLHPYFNRRTGLPHHDGLFQLPAEEAFALLLSRPEGTMRASVDFSPLVGPGPPDPEAAARAAGDAIRPVFTFEASHLAASYLLCFLRFQRHRMRRLASDRGIDVSALASRDPALADPGERAYLAHARALTRAVASVPGHIPAPVGPALALADPRPLFLTAASHFPSEAHAHAFCGTFAYLRTLPAESWLSSAHPSADPAFLASPGFLEVLESAIAFASLARRQLARDPRVGWCSPWGFAPALRCGGVHIAAAGLSPGTEAGWAAGEDARAVMGWLAAMGEIHRPWGYNLARRFEDMMEAAGLVGGGERPPAGDGALTSFSGAALATETWMKPYVR